MALSKEELQNLSDLFLSKEEDNTRLAFEIMGKHEFTKELITEIFVVFKLTEVEDFRIKAKEILLLHGSDAVKKAMKRKLELKGRGYSAPTEKKIKTNIKKYVKGNELEGIKFAKAMYNKYGSAISYLLDECTEEERRKLLNNFVEGKVLSLTGKALTKLPKELYELTDLEEINLRGNKISTISSKFKVFKNLKILKMGGNTLKKLDKCLANLPIEELYLRGNLFETFPEVIAKIKTLKILDLRDATNKYEFSPVEMPAEFQQLPNLQKLSLTGNTLNRCRHEYKGYPRFSTVISENEQGLDLSFLALAKLAYKQNKEALHYIFTNAEPDYIIEVLKDFYDEKTKTLDLSGFTITYLPKEIALFDIHHLIAKDCRLHTTLHGIKSSKEEMIARMENLGTLTNLESLDFSKALTSYNGLIEAALEQLAYCKKLKKLNLKGCVSETFPEAMTALTSLEELEYTRGSSERKLVQFPKSIANMKNLKRLSLTKVYDWDSGSYEPQEKHLAELQKLIPNCSIETVNG